MTDAPDTYLRLISAEIGEVVFPVRAARGIDVDVSPIDAGELRRTVNGTLKNLSNPLFRKVKISLAHSGGRVPTLVGLWRGMPVTVHLPDPVEQLPTPGTPTEAVLARQPVPGSVKGVTVEGVEIIPSASSTTAPWNVTFPSAVSYVTYRPILQCLVASWSRSENDWGRSTSWSVELEEV